MNQSYVPHFPRCPQTIPLNADEEELFGNLELTILENLEPVDYGRKAAKESIQAVLTFLLNRGLSGQAMNALIQTFDAFRDLEAGTQPELFDVLEPRKSVAKGPRKWTRSQAGQAVKIFCTTCMGALMASGMRETEAAAKVARHAQSWPRFSEGIIQASTVANWRDEVLQQPEASIERHQYVMLVGHFVREGQLTPFLQEVLDKGPALTFGRRKTET